MKNDRHHDVSEANGPPAPLKTHLVSVSFWLIYLHLKITATMGPASNGTSNGNGASAHLQRLEEAERRKREMEQKRAAAAVAAAGGLPPSRSMSSASAGGNAGSGKRGGRGAAGRSSRERSQRRNGTYILLLVTTLTATIGLNVAHHTITGGGTAQVSVRAAEKFLAKHFNTAMDVLETEVHQLENHLGHVWHGDDEDNGKETAYDEAVGHGEDAAGGMKPWLNKGGDRRVEVGDDVNAKDERETTSNDIGDGHTLGGLSCAKHGGPSDEVAAEMVYWSDIPSDSQFVSPFKKEGETKYMTFEPDGGGWNNIRMAMETVVALAHATGRTLVMPPEQRMYLLGKGDKEHKKHFGFGDFYQLESLSDEHKGLDIISMEEFLEREAMTGNLKNRTTGIVMYPPGNRTNWDGGSKDEITSLKEYLREVTLTPLWKPDKCLAAFPSAPGPTEIESLHKMRANIMAEHGRKGLEEQDQSAPDVLGSAQDRMQQNLLGRDLCIYDEEMQEAPVIHFMCYHKMRVRLLVHFYAFLYFESALQDLWTKRFIRDHLRYKDEMQCAAARAVNFIRDRARARDPKGNPDGLFDSAHIRRGDFQYKRTRVDADVLYTESMKELTENATVFVATDERDKAFFQPLRDHYDLVFLDDVMHLFEDMNPNNFGMLDQLIASKGRIFYGTFHSTFTGWINRMRGYYIDKHQLEGSADGTMESYYFVPEDKKMCMKSYSHIHFPFFAREYPTAWYSLDKGVDQLAAEVQVEAVAAAEA